MAKGDGMGKFGNAAIRGGSALQGQPGLAGFMQANPNFGGGKFAGKFGSGQMGNTPAMSFGGNMPMRGGNMFGNQFGGGQQMPDQSMGGMVGPSMPQIRPNPEFEKAYGNFRDQGMDFPGAMDAAQNQMGGSRGGFNPGFGGGDSGRFGRGIRAPMGGFGRGMRF